MKKIIFHIGSHKTGTTSIQIGLQKKYAELSALDIYLPNQKSELFVESNPYFNEANRLRSTGNYSDIAIALRESSRNFRDVGYLERIIQDFEISEESSLIISGEEFGGLHLKEIAELKNLFMGCDFEYHLIYFVRHQSECLVGLYQTAITYSNFQNNFDEFCESILHYFDFSKVIQQWNDNFAFTSISVEQYINPETGEPIDSVNVFSRLISKICATDIQLPSTNANRGVGGDTIQLLECLSSVNDQQLIQSIRALSNLLPNELEQIEFLSKPRYEYINDLYHESNLELQKTYGIYPTSLIQIKKIQLKKCPPSIEETIKNALVSIARKIEKGVDSP
jgi:hypothetical protein